MSKINEKTATLISTGNEIKVYKHKLSDNWINSNDCTTSYKPSELRFK